MLVEAAFYKLPEVLTSRMDHADTYEDTLRSSFVACLMMELNSRHIQNAYEHIDTEKPYPTINQHRWRADLLLKLEGAVNVGGRRSLYGMRELTWIELKGFFSSTRSRSTQQRSKQTGTVLRDILRVSLLPEELLGKIRQNARYVLIVLANEPSVSFSFGSSSARPWLDSLFREGRSDLEVRLADEPKTLRRGVGEGFVVDDKLEVSLQIHTHCFEPVGREPLPVFWGYLVRVEAFELRAPQDAVIFKDVPGSSWSPEQDKDLATVRSYFVDRVRGS